MLFFLFSLSLVVFSLLQMHWSKDVAILPSLFLVMSEVTTVDMEDSMYSMCLTGNNPAHGNTLACGYPLFLPLFAYSSDTFASHSVKRGKGSKLSLFELLRFADLRVHLAFRVVRYSLVALDGYEQKVGPWAERSGWYSDVKTSATTT